jgi:hypothetical protein
METRDDKRALGDVSIGDRVGCEYRDPPEHQPWIPEPHRGTVVPCDDPELWRETMAFPGRLPTRKEVQAHFEELAKLPGWQNFEAQGRVAVRWDFGKTYFERRDALYAVRADVIPIRSGATAGAAVAA